MKVEYGLDIAEKQGDQNGAQKILEAHEHLSEQNLKKA